jgi:hypothetical protein
MLYGPGDAEPFLYCNACEYDAREAAKVVYRGMGEGPAAIDIDELRACVDEVRWRVDRRVPR